MYAFFKTPSSVKVHDFANQRPSQDFGMRRSQALCHETELLPSIRYRLM